MLVAKVIADKQYWILQADNQKVGNIEAMNGGYQVRIHDQVKQFKTIKLAARESNIVFDTQSELTLIILKKLIWITCGHKLII